MSYKLEDYQSQWRERPGLYLKTEFIELFEPFDGTEYEEYYNGKECVVICNYKKFIINFVDAEIYSTFEISGMSVVLRFMGYDIYLKDTRIKRIHKAVAIQSMYLDFLRDDIQRRVLKAIL